MTARTTQGEPHIDRSITLQFQGDWGQANLHRICGWLAQEFNDRAGAGSRTATWTGRGGSDAIEAIVDRSMDLALVVPAYVGHSAVSGTGMFQGAPRTELRALGTLPQDDRLVLAVGSEHGIESLDDLRSKRVPLKIATSPNDGINTIGFAVDRVLAAHGIDREAFLGWGGSFLEDERPFPPLRWYRDGEADAVFTEAIMTPPWQELASARPTTFVPLDDAALSKIEKELGWPRAVLRGGYLPGLEDDLVTLDFSDFLVLVHEEMPDDVAYLLTWCMVHTSHAIERHYHHIPSERSPLNYPFQPEQMRDVPVPLHPAAARCYDELA
jgi:TRAP transporter TAXI family solute receptor